MTAGSVFDNLEAIRLSPDAAATAGTREVLRHVPVRKPNRTEFIRVHPDADMQIATGVFIDREEREVSFVVPELRAELAGELKPVLLVTAISRQGQRRCENAGTDVTGWARRHRRLGCPH
jgi:hypothetical protein